MSVREQTGSIYVQEFVGDISSWPKHLVLCWTSNTSGELRIKVRDHFHRQFKLERS
jgi:hypothetical protein